MSFKIPVTFMQFFKIGDNIDYNLKTQKILYDVYASLPENEKKYLIKPIVIINSAIIEALMYDFIEFTIKHPNRTEVIPDLEEAAQYIRNKEVNKFCHYIDQFSKHNLLKMDSEKLYEAMRDLSKSRNRIHIQNDKYADPEDEKDCFTPDTKELSEKALEKTLRRLSELYPRREKYHKYVKDFCLPWKPYYG